MRKSACCMRLGKPLRQMRMPSSTPLQVSWFMTSPASRMTGLLDLVGDEAADEVGMGGVEHGHELVEGLAVEHGDGHHGAGLALLLPAAASLGLRLGLLLLGHVVAPDVLDQDALPSLFFMTPTAVSLSGSLFFSSQLRTL